MMGRLVTGPLGSYAYGNAAHIHAATGIGTTWTAAYDAVRNMTCRAPSPSSTCAGTPTGAQLGYNNEGELTTWQNAPTSPSTTDSFLYDGHGQRVAQQVTSGSTTTTTIYVGGVEEVATSGAATTTTAFYYASGKRIGLSVNGVVSYLAGDGLGSANVTLSASGSPTGSVLYAPYGVARYSNGLMPGTYGFTGQRADAASGLDYYGARYYDPLAGQFASADNMLPGGGFDLWGLSHYSYVEGNPIIRVDPTGRSHQCPDGGCGEPPPDPVGSGPEPNPGIGPTVGCGCPGNPAPYQPPYQPPPLGGGSSSGGGASSAGAVSGTTCDVLPQCASSPPPKVSGVVPTQPEDNQWPWFDGSDHQLAVLSALLSSASLAVQPIGWMLSAGTDEPIPMVYLDLVGSVLSLAALIVDLKRKDYFAVAMDAIGLIPTLAWISDSFKLTRMGKELREGVSLVVGTGGYGAIASEKITSISHDIWGTVRQFWDSRPPTKVYLGAA
jgi:RHS repeat-associated protein